LERSEKIDQFLRKYTLTFNYQSKYIQEKDIEGFILNYLKENRDRDILTGHTHIGPHLDDFGFIIDDLHEASMYLSRGEIKMLLLGLKQLEVEFLQTQLNIPVILLFDDLFAELDMQHAEILIEKFRVHQVIVTTQRELPKEGKWKDFSCINITPE
jgi:DNA replication and repair protein RecF